MTREEAIKKLQKQKAEYLEEWVDYSGIAEAYDMAIEALSTDIVRCKDCRHYKSITDGFGVCNERQTVLTTQRDDDFCSYGERREP